MSAFFTRLWNLRLIRYGVWLIVGLVGTYTLFCAYVNWTGSRRWAEAKAILAREGETLDFEKLQPVPVDESLNFCAIEPLREITLPGDEKSAPGLKRTAMENTVWKYYHAPSDRPAGGKRKKGIPPAMQIIPPPSIRGGRALGLSCDIHAWAAFARASNYAALPAEPGDPGRDLLGGIDASYPLLRQLADAASVRPEAVFVPRLHSPTPLFAAMPQFSPTQTVTNALVVRAMAACEGGNSPSACQSVQAVLRLVDAAAREPLLIGVLVAVTNHEKGEEAVWAILKKRQATGTELQALQASLATLDFRKAVLMEMRGELAAAVDVMEYVQAGPHRLPELMGPLLWDGNSPSPAPPTLKRLLWGLVPSGLFDHNKAVIATMEIEQIIRPLRLGNAHDVLRHLAAFDAELKVHQGPFHPHHRLVDVMAPAFSSVIERTFEADAIRRQAVIACALERYYLQNKSYPAALVELVPTLLAAVPADPMDDKPMRYRKTDDGRYMLWSVGFDLKDDGGKVNIDPNDRSSVHKLYKRGYKGDWTWQYQPIK